jgi:long-chain-acyl-CoA dehydrogenase
MAAGECIGAIAMTEPGAGSDLQGIRTTAVRDGDAWVLNGAKTFITNGINSDLVIVVARTDPGAGAHGISLLGVERGMPGFTRGRKLDKIGLHAQDTAELFFDDVRVPAANLLEREGGGFVHLMERLPRERMSIAMLALTSARAALGWTVDYTTARTAFGQPLAAFQNTAFELASAVTEVDVLEAQCRVDRVAVGSQLDDQRIQRNPIENDRDEDPALPRGQFLIHGPSQRSQQIPPFGLLHGIKAEAGRQPIPVLGVQPDVRMPPEVPPDFG